MASFTCEYCYEAFPHWDDYIYHINWECEKEIKKQTQLEEKYEL